MKNIVICGGHFSPALAVIENLQKKRGYRIFYFGRKQALEGDSAGSLEYNLLTKKNISFYSIVTGRLQREFTIHTIPSFLKFPVGLIQTFVLLLVIRPKIVVSFGGYVALPVCFSARILGIPVITHEQTYYVGLANRIIARFAQVLCLSFTDTKNIPRGVNTILTGNPIRTSIFTDKGKKIENFGDKKLPLLYITGGNLGSRSINEAIGKILPSLCVKYRVLHQCGNADNSEDFKYLSRLKNSLEANFRQNYNLVEHIEPSEAGPVYKDASLVIGRAGANTVNEILAFGVPAIFIPLPWAGQNEQEKNALLVESVGLGEIIRQSELTAGFLLDKINSMIGRIAAYKQNSQRGKSVIRVDGAEQIVKLIDKYSNTQK